MNRKTLSLIAIASVLSAALLAYFVKYTPDLAPIVDPSYETSAPELQSSPNQKFVDKVVSSNIGIILMHSDFSDKNAIALESLRTWAKERFSEDPMFLHPASLRYSEHHDTVLSALFYNVFAPLRSVLDRSIKGYLRWRIDEYHNTEAYQSFRIDYYDLFGVDPEAATLLSRYQEERAKLAIEIIAACAYVLTAIVGGVILYARLTQTRWMARGRLTLSYAWYAASLLYLALAWQSSEVAFFASGLIAFIIASYLRRPISVSFDESGFLEIRLSDLNQKTVALAAWASITLVGIQVVTWAKSGSLIEPDPITLLICSVTGNFLHDPSHAKKTIDQVVGLVWLALSLWFIYFLKRGDARTPELDAQLEKLDHATASRV